MNTLLKVSEKIQMKRNHFKWQEESEDKKGALSVHIEPLSVSQDSLFKTSQNLILLLTRRHPGNDVIWSLQLFPWLEMHRHWIIYKIFSPMGTLFYH